MTSKPQAAQTPGSDHKRVEDGVKAILEKHLPVEMKKLQSSDEQRQDYLGKFLTTVCEKAVKIEEDMEWELTYYGKSNVDVPLGLLKFYTRSHLKAVQRAFDFVTFDMQLLEVGGKKTVRFHRNGKDVLVTDDFNTATIAQIASVVIEGVIVVLKAVGVAVSSAGSEVDDATKEVVEKLENNAELMKQLLDLIQQMKSQDTKGRAESIFDMIKVLYNNDLFWDLCKALLGHMAWYDWILTAAEIAAEIVAAVTTDGLALIAKIVLTLSSAGRLIEKLANFEQLGH